uniref:Uncharacterized protein n=1 Tax=Salix viminalis TaxID=40686 RepID=A0A6N2M2R6_SALVM
MMKAMCGLSCTACEYENAGGSKDCREEVFVGEQKLYTSTVKSAYELRGFRGQECNHAPLRTKCSGSKIIAGPEFSWSQTRALC